MYNKQSGYYGEVSKLSKKMSRLSKKVFSEDVNHTALTGSEFGYKFFVEKGNYNIKLNFAELEKVENRTFDILVNGNPYKEGYVLNSNEKIEEIGQVYPENGVIDVKLVSAYNTDGIETKPILNGISRCTGGTDKTRSRKTGRQRSDRIPGNGMDTAYRSKLLLYEGSGAHESFWDRAW